MASIKKSEAETGVGSLDQFARVAERVAATTKKLEKAALLGEYFHALGDADLVRAARYFAGQQFAQHDQRTTNVGGAVLREALGAVTGLDAENLRPRYVRLGDAGEVTFEAMSETRAAAAGAAGDQPPGFTLAETEALVERLSA
ncbi:MAG: hypothetical protein ACRD9R_09650, partial [Pyrinomonadaceae bacterium]